MLAAQAKLDIAIKELKAARDELDKCRSKQMGLRDCKRRFADLLNQKEAMLRELNTADYFFEGIFADWAVMDRIHHSQEQIAGTQRQIGVKSWTICCRKLSAGRIPRVCGSKNSL